MKPWLEVTVRRVAALGAGATATLQLLGCSVGGGSLPREYISTAQAEALYRERCANCHNGAVARAPDPAGLRNLSSERIRVSLTTGVMSEQGKGLTPAQLDALSRHLGRADAAPGAQASATTRCTGSIPWPADALAQPHWNGWGAGAAQLRAQPAESAQLASTDVPRLKLKWAYGVGDTIVMASQPTVVGGRIFIGGAKVRSLDAASGCTHWDFAPDAPVRGAMSVASGASGAWSVYFGDQRGNVYAVDAWTGALRWRTSLDTHPAARVTGAPTLYEGKLYVPMSSIEEASSVNPKYQCCTFRGSVSAIDAATGKVLWKRYTIAQEPMPQGGGDPQHFGPSGAGIWSSPTIDAAKRRLYVTTSNSYSDPPADTANAILALDLDTGALVWSKQMTANDAYTMACNATPPGTGNCPASGGPDVDFGSSAMLLTLANGRRVLIAGQKSGVVHALDPDRDGALLWQTRLGRGGTLGGVQWGTASDGRLVYAALSDVRIERASAGTPGAQPALGTHLRFDPKAGGGMHALDVQTGRQVWKTPHPGCNDKPGCSPAQSAAVTAIPGVVFSGGLDGHLRAYDAQDGRIVWDVDTAIAYANTVNSVPARGGSLDGPGAVVVGGMLYVGSGYAVFGGMPGNALLAFSVDGR